MTVDLAILEEVFGRAVLRHAERGGVEDGVAAGGVVDVGLGGERLFEVDERREEVDVGVDHLGGIGGLLIGLGDDHGDRLADVAHLVAGQQRACSGWVER